MISKRQQDIKQIRPKCKFKTWTPMPYREESTAGEPSSVDIRLTILPSKVIFYGKGENFLEYFSHVIGIFTSGCQQGGRRIQVLIWWLHWQLRRIFGAFSWRKHPWLFGILWRNLYKDDQLLFKLIRTLSWSTTSEIRIIIFAQCISHLKSYKKQD